MRFLVRFLAVSVLAPAFARSSSLPVSQGQPANAPSVGGNFRGNMSPSGSLAGTPPLLVQVVIGNPESGFVGAAGAKVSLVPVSSRSDTWCAEDAFHTCSARGYTTFEGLSGPFSITAQVDYVPPGSPSETVRLAMSLIDIHPTSRRLVIPIFVEDEEPDLVLDANLSGTVTSIPALGGSESLTVEVSTREGGPDYNYFSYVSLDPQDPSMGTYDVAVPSGYTMDLALVRRSSNLQGGGPSAASLFLGRSFASGANNLNLTYGSGALLPFSPTQVTFPNAIPGTGAREVFMNLSGPAGEDVEIMLFKGTSTMPSSIMLPPNSHVAYLGLDPGVMCEQYDWITDEGASAWETLAVTDLSFNMLGLPAVGLPTSPIPMPSAFTQDFPYSPGPGALGWGNGLDSIDIESESPGIAGIDAVYWSLLTRQAPMAPAVMKLPPTALPMFGAGSSFDFAMNTSRFDANLDIDALFNQSFESNFALFQETLGVESDAEMLSSFDTDTCDVELFQGLGEIPVRMIELVPNSNVSAAMNNWILATRIQSDPLATLNCIVDTLNVIYTPQTGVSFYAEGVEPVSIGPEHLTTVFNGTWGPDQEDGVLSRSEVSALAYHLNFVSGKVGTGRLVLAPVHAFGGVDALGNPWTPLGVVSGRNQDPGTNTVCDDVRALADVDNLAFVSDFGDNQTFAHEVGHCLGLAHCVTPNNLMNRDRAPSNPPTPSDTDSGSACGVHCPEKCFSQAQIQQVQEAACSYLTGLGPWL